MNDERYPGFRDFVDARGAALSRAAFLLTGDHHAAEDLVQSALARVLRHWRRIEGGDPEAYVRRVMYNLQMSWWRRRRVPEHLAATPPDRPGTDPYAAAALRLSLDRALALVTPKQRAVLVLRFYEDLTEAQAADLLGCSVGTVKRHAHDGLARLRAVAPHLVDDVRITGGLR
ncbi:SigE family RNA polymerase sigma factor [Dactylosporangium matsuzakiense]|uniref:DNA-directed RNA polymerase sigma-70 factor n=1 Tax=Dactylosporangium matsuzakiense TaxID=53360 RepID=A0A9W6NKJ9_9ACTN|nr:SigE family RNA polymerase sigma factor [Dactylosporangium matsuzakiense]UWZ41088.1 SigE family RNA polymerase sigma factor [Dactylosporangium matsuzakiense]GLL01015.1 DNA-directed RNA polymerase sigma-70 factor [Dactylosporangium matsuzakiense]